MCCREIKYQIASAQTRPPHRETLHPCVSGYHANNNKTSATPPPDHRRHHHPISMSAPTIATRGLFIVVEGLDRAGKTTQVEQLRRRLAANRSSTAVAQASATTTPDGQSQGQDQIDVHVAKFPDRSTPTGQVLDAYLKSSAQLDDRAAHLIFSANRWEAMCVFLPCCRGSLNF